MLERQGGKEDGKGPFQTQLEDEKAGSRAAKALSNSFYPPEKGLQHPAALLPETALVQGTVQVQWLINYSLDRRSGAHSAWPAYHQGQVAHIQPTPSPV